MNLFTANEWLERGEISTDEKLEIVVNRFSFGIHIETINNNTQITIE